MIKVGAGMWDFDSNRMEVAAAAGTLAEVLLLQKEMVLPVESLGRMMNMV